MTGIPGLASIPLLRRLFTGESVDRERQELMIALIPHIVRRPEFTAENLRGIAVGNAAERAPELRPPPSADARGRPGRPRAAMSRRSRPPAAIPGSPTSPLASPSRAARDCLRPRAPAGDRSGRHRRRLRRRRLPPA